MLEAIGKYKPKKILEVGIAAGANSAMILEYLEQNDLLDSTQLYAIDYNTEYYMDIDANYYKDLYSWFGKNHSTPPPSNRKSGFLVQELTPHLQSYYNLYTGGFAANHIDKVGKGVDLVVIDTVHAAPGEALDFLMVYPYLSKNAVVIFHDIAFHILANTELTSNICQTMFLSFSGKKYVPKPYEPYKPHFQNIGLCVFDDSNDDLGLAWLYFRILSMPWYYMPNDEDLGVFREFCQKHYDSELVAYFDDVLELQKKRLSHKPKLKGFRKFRHKIKRFLGLPHKL